jgi:cellulose synthase/poly-beta-1,6-N-acetylglucosamine synthase-like glycosyltransferase
VLHDFRLYDLFVLSFVQLVVMTVLVLSPARNIDTRFRWTGSRVTEVILGTIAAAIVAAVSGFITWLFWDLPVSGLGTAAYVLVIVSFVVIVWRPDTSVVGKLFYAAYAAAGFTFLGYAAVLAANHTKSIAETLTASLLILLDLLAFLVWNSNIHYVSDVMCRTRRSRPLPEADPNYQPMVSIHIPAYNEPPELLIATIKAVEEIDYPDFEIIVIDNNTQDEAIYGPVEEYCRGRDRIKFVHVAPWPGYKAGACNLAFRRYTDPRAEIIAMIDADDIVKPHYLKETIGYFVDPKIGFVQTFEGNRDYEGSKYYQACVDSYQGFYLAVMSSRNERDTIPFVGTMGLFRRKALEEIGGWNEWCISEDTEASLRVLKAGWSGLYIPRCFGRGVVPPSFAGLNTQRHRWCFGAMQIFRLHWRSLMPWDRSPDNHLTPAQRRDYLMACCSWFRDLLMFVFALLLLVVTGLVLAGSSFALMPVSGEAALLPLSLIIVATITMTWTLRHWTTISVRRAFRALCISLSASWITALACIQGLTHREGVFLRTAKKKATNENRLRTAFRLSRVELVLAVSLYASIACLFIFTDPSPLLILTVLVQATVYACSPVAAFWNLRAQRVPAEEYRRRHAERRFPDSRQPARSFATPRFAAVLVVAALAGAVIAFFSAPAKLSPVSVANGHQTQSVTKVASTSGKSGQQEDAASVAPTSRQ